MLNKEHFTFYLQYKHSGTFSNCKHVEMEKLFECRGPRTQHVLPQKSENVLPHFSNSIENATPL